MEKRKEEEKKEKKKEKQKKKIEICAAVVFSSWCICSSSCRWQMQREAIWCRCDTDAYGIMK